MPRIRPCRSCGKPCQLGGSSPRQDPMCRDCQRRQPSYGNYGIPCAGGCGKLIHRGPNSANTPTCMDCIRSRSDYKGKYVQAEPAELTCIVCGNLKPARWKNFKTCGSEECRRKVRTLRKKRYVARTPDALIKGRCKVWHVNCAECGRLFVARQPNQARCGDECRRRYNSRVTSEWVMRRYRADPEFRDLVISRAQNRRADKLGVGEITTPAALVTYLIKRDHGRCGICRQPIRAKTGPRRPSIHHIVPLSRDGRHELANLQPAHYVCNLRKNNGGGGEQLLLVG